MAKRLSVAEPVPEVVQPKKKYKSLVKRLRFIATMQTATNKRAKLDDPPLQTTTPYKLPVQIKGVVPEGVRLATDMAMDDIYGALNGMDGFFQEGLHFLGFPYLAQLSQRSEYRQLSEIMAEEMTRKWIRFTSDDNSTEDNDAEGDDDGEGKAEGDKEKVDKIKKLDEAFKLHDIKSKYRRLIELDAQFGRAHLFVDPDDGAATDDELKTLLSRDKSKLANYKKLKFVVVEPMWVYPSMYNALNPLHEDFYRPAIWYSMGKQVHRTRLLTLVTRPVPDLLKPAYSFAGMSLSQMAKPYIDNWLRTRQSISDLVHSFAINILQTEMGAVLTDEDDDGQGLIDRIAMFNANRDNLGVFAIDKTMEDLKQVTTPLGTLDKLQAQAQEHIAGVGRVPLVKLLGVTPSGLNASSDGEIRVFYDTTHSAQEKSPDLILRDIFNILQISLFGQIDPALDYVYEPLWQMDEQAKSMVRKSNADTAAVYIADGIVSAEEERRRIANEDGGVYNGLDPDDMPEPPEQSGIDPNSPEGQQSATALQGAQSAAPAKPQASGGKTATDIAARTLYVNRPVLNSKGLKAWARNEGIKLDDDLHITLAFSKIPLLWSQADENSFIATTPLLLTPNALRSLTVMGTKLVLTIESKMLADRHAEIRKAGASWDWPTYTPHISLCDAVDAPLSPTPYRGDIMLDSEEWTIINPKFATDEADFKESEHPRDTDGKFGSGGGGRGKPAATKPASAKPASAKPASAKPTPQKGAPIKSTLAKTVSSKSGELKSFRTSKNLQSTKIVNGQRKMMDGSSLPEHILALKLPPAWTNVHISLDPNAKLLAQGKDSKGRTQSSYRESHTISQAEAKFSRVKSLNQQFDGIVAQNKKEQLSKVPRTKDSADCLALVMSTGVRPGSEDDTGADTKAYGATTLKGEHVVVSKDGVSLKFTGKKGVALNLPVTDTAIAAMLTKRAKAAGPQGQIFPNISDRILLDYIHKMGDGSFMTKDFRTHLGSRTAAEAVASMPHPGNDPKDYKKAVMQVAKLVSLKLGNTPIIALQSYINPTVFSQWRSVV